MSVCEAVGHVVGTQVPSGVSIKEGIHEQPFSVLT